MPKWLHEQLSSNARKKGLKGERYNAYVYGTLHEYEKRKKNVGSKHRERAMLRHGKDKE